MFHVLLALIQVCRSDFIFKPTVSSSAVCEGAQRCGEECRFSVRSTKRCSASEPISCLGEDSRFTIEIDRRLDSMVLVEGSKSPGFLLLQCNDNLVKVYEMFGGRRREILQITGRYSRSYLIIDKEVVLRNGNDFPRVIKENTLEGELKLTFTNEAAFTVVNSVYTFNSSAECQCSEEYPLRLRDRCYTWQMDVSEAVTISHDLVTLRHTLSVPSSTPLTVNKAWITVEPRNKGGALDNGTHIPWFEGTDFEDYIVINGQDRINLSALNSSGDRFHSPSKRLQFPALEGSVITTVELYTLQPISDVTLLTSCGCDECNAVTGFSLCACTDGKNCRSLPTDSPATENPTEKVTQEKLITDFSTEKALTEVPFDNRTSEAAEQLPTANFTTHAARTDRVTVANVTDVVRNVTSRNSKPVTEPVREVTTAAEGVPSTEINPTASPENATEKAVTEAEEGTEKAVTEEVEGTEKAVTEEGTETAVTEAEEGTETAVTEAEEGTEKTVTEAEEGTEKAVTKEGTEELPSNATTRPPVVPPTTPSTHSYIGRNLSEFEADPRDEMTFFTLMEDNLNFTMIIHVADDIHLEKRHDGIVHKPTRLLLRGSCDMNDCDRISRPRRVSTELLEEHTLYHHSEQLRYYSKYLYIFYTTTIREEKIISTPGKKPEIIGNITIRSIASETIEAVEVQWKDVFRPNNKVITPGCFVVTVTSGNVTMVTKTDDTFAFFNFTGLPGAESSHVTVEVMLKTVLGNITARSELEEHKEAVASAVYVVAWVIGGCGILAFIVVIGCVIYKCRKNAAHSYHFNPTTLRQVYRPSEAERSKATNVTNQTASTVHQNRMIEKDSEVTTLFRVKRVNASENLVAMTGAAAAVATLEAEPDLDTSSITQCKVEANGDRIVTRTVTSTDGCSQTFL